MVPSSIVEEDFLGSRTPTSSVNKTGRRISLGSTMFPPVCAGLIWALVVAAGADISTLQNAKTTVANSLWGKDAFPNAPRVEPQSKLTIAYFNSSRGGRVTHIHLVLEGPPRDELQRHVALSITYNDAPYPSVFVPVGDFFLDQWDSNSLNFESSLFAKRNVNSWHCKAPMPYKKSIRIELVNAASKAVGGYNYVYHEDLPFDESSAYFHAYYAPNFLLSFPWEPAPLLPPEGVEGPGHLVGTAMVFTSKNRSKFNGNFNHVCEGNYEWFVDNTTLKFGNDTSNDYVRRGYQTSEDVVAVLGSEDWYGYSFGWAGNDSKLAKQGLFATEHTGTTLWEQGSDTVMLATYNFLPSPLRFRSHLWGQVNWHYDTGHNVPVDLCPRGEGCAISYEVVSYFYVAKPRDASAEQARLPWPYPLTTRTIPG